jgi:hypothetical protein
MKTMSARRALPIALRAACLALLACLAAHPRGMHAQELMLAKSLPDLVQEAQAIVVADLVGAHARRNARGNVIVTDYRFRTVRTLLGPSQPGFVLTQGGGTLDGETQAISDTPELVPGNRYLLFVRPGHGEMFAPFVGGAQGAWRLDADHTALPLGLDRRALDQNVLFAQVDALIGQRGAAPPRFPDTGAPPPHAYPSKAYRPLALTPPAWMGPQVSPLSPSPAEGPSASGGGAPERRDAFASEPAPVPDSHWEHRITPPAVIDGFPHDWTPWYPEDEYQMSSWNQYGGDIFHVYTVPTGDWAWGNDRFDLAGWPDDATMVAQFGEHWGASTLGITYTRWFGDGPIVEADTALNPAYCWTLDESIALDGDDPCWGFRQTMRHELGHSWGLKHPWETQSVWWDSIMNYSPKNDRHAELFTDDTNAVRSAFGGPAIHDALLSLYTTDYSATNTQSSDYFPTQAFSVSLHHGDDLATWITGAFKIENLGTDDVPTPTVQFFLSQAGQTWAAGYAYLGSGVYATVPFYSTYTYTLPALPIPYATPTGTYWLGAYLPDADANMDNNSAWADKDVTVHVDNNPSTLVPGPDWQASETGLLGPGGDWTFRFAGTAGATYVFSLCDGTGGWADFDTTLAIEDAGTTLASDDDTCGVQSQVTWTAPYAATFTVRVASYNGWYQGSFQLGYVREVVDTVFTSGFDG